jgi:hypothetical protein
MAECEVRRVTQYKQLQPTHQQSAMTKVLAFESHLVTKTIKSATVTVAGPDRLLSFAARPLILERMLLLLRNNSLFWLTKLRHFRSILSPSDA